MERNMFIKQNTLFSEYTINEIKENGKKALSNTSIPFGVRFKAVENWIDQINKIPLKNRKESVLETSFIKTILCEVLGHSLVGDSGSFTLIPKDGTENFPDIKGGCFTTLNSYFTVRPKFLIELKGPRCINFRAPQTSRPDRKSPAQQVISDMFMEQEQCVFSVVTNMIDFEIFSRSFADKRSISFSLNNLVDYDDLYLLYGLISSDSLLMNPDIVSVHFKKNENSKKAVSKKFYGEFKDCRDNLFKAVSKDLKDDQSNHFVTKLLSQILFIIYGESTGLIPRESLSNVLELGDYEWSNYRKFCGAMDKGGKFAQLDLFGYNGGLFYPNSLFKKEYNKNVLKSISGIAQFKFTDKAGSPLSTDDVRDILGRVLEFSLETNKEENLYNFTEQGTFAEARKKQATKNERQRKGTFYTKRYITKYMIERTISLLKADKVNISKSKWLDPACGSGAFLVEMFDQLSEHEKAKVGLKDDMILRNKSGKMILNQIESDVIDRIRGTDFDPLAAGISQLSISMKCCRPYEKLPLLNDTISHCDSLKEGVKKPLYNVIVANPPYMRWESIPKAYRSFLLKDDEFSDLAEIGADYSAFFFRDAYRKLKPGGYLTFIATNKLLSSAQAEKFRKWLTESFHIVEIFDFRKAVFSGTDVETAIIILQKKKDANENHQSYRDVFSYSSSENHLEPTQFSDVSFKHIENSPFWTIPAKTSPEIQSVLNWFYDNKSKLNLMESFFEPKTGLRITDISKADVLQSKPKENVKKLYEPLFDGTSFQHGKDTRGAATRFIRKDSKKLTAWKSTFLGENYLLFKELSTRPVIQYSRTCPAILCSLVAFKEKKNLKEKIDFKSLTEYLNSPVTDTFMEFWFGSNRTHKNQRWKQVYINKVPFPKSCKLNDIPAWVLKACIQFRDGIFEDVSSKEIEGRIRAKATRIKGKAKSKSRKKA